MRPLSDATSRQWALQNDAEGFPLVTKLQPLIVAKRALGSCDFATKLQSIHLLSQQEHEL
jgi:hypothetical protein